MKGYLVAVALCLAVVMPAIAQTPEEIIRQTYAKGIFSNQVGLIERNVRLGAPAKGDDSLQATLQQNQLKFTLSDFKTGISQVTTTRSSRSAATRLASKYCT